MDHRGTNVLIVEADAEERERLTAAIEQLGFDVVRCPGPSGPDYTCVGGREGRCPLVDPADVVVLDLWLESDTVFLGTPAAELLTLYRSSGKPVIALGATTGPLDQYDGEPVTYLARRPDLDELLRAVEDAVATR